MSLPTLAIVGRPNVGKSSLFNRLAGSRKSIVEATPGVTRDRVSALCDIDEKTFFELVDTGGVGIVDCDDLTEHVEQQIRYAIDQAQLILFIVDGREGLTPLDRRTSELLRRHTERVRLIANKVDEPHMTDRLGEFMKLGFGEPLAVSAMSGAGRWALDELITSCLAGIETEPEPQPAMNIAIVGKRNAGKSTFINALAGEDRVIVSEVPGTTRDSVDVRIVKDGRTVVAIDTAGVRKKSKMENDVEFYAYTRMTRAVERADVVLFLIDAAVPVGQVDKRLARDIASMSKPCILVVNKWDLAKGKTSTEEFGEYLSKTMPHVDYAPISLTTANKSRNVASTMDLATELFKQSRIRVTTGQLNAALQSALDDRSPPTKRGKKAPRFYYATQVSTSPPTIVIFVNHPNNVTQTYERFLLNRLRDRLPYPEIPIRLAFRARRASRTES